MAKDDVAVTDEADAGIALSTIEAERELADVVLQIDEARMALLVWRRAMFEAEKTPERARSAQLIEANEQLILAALSARTEVDATSRELDALARSKGFDALTGLPNRAQFLDQLSSAIAFAQRNGTRLGLLFIDLNNFKEINDAFGHTIGDEVLKLAAQRLASAVRADDMICRYGGDEFLVLVTELTHRSDGELIADKLIASLGTPASVGNHQFILSASIGSCVYPDDGKDARTLIALADAAMYGRKRMLTVGSSQAAQKTAPVVSLNPQPAAPRSTELVSTCAELGSPLTQRRHAQLREANAALILAALDAQTLQAAAELLLRQQKDALAVVAHELRTPLTPIRIASDMLGRARPDEMQRYQTIIESEIEHMVAVINDLLDVSRFETGKLRIESQSIELGRVIAAATDACLPAMNDRKQQLAVDVPQQPIQMDADPIRLAQILRNLLDNASKYTPHGGDIALSVAVVGDSVVITVADNGIGITAEALKSVFEPFTQELHAMRFNGVGLGLGLAVVRELVAAHGGSVVANSEGLGRGTRFVVTLPLVLAGRKATP